MTQTQIKEFVDATTALDEKYLNTAAISESCLLTGSIPASSGSLVITLGALTYIVNTGGAATFQTHTPAPITISGGASSTNYVFINASGTLSQSTSNTPGAGFVTLLKCVVNGGNSALTSITQMLSGYASDASNISADQAEAATADTLSPLSTLLNNLNRIRKAITNITGGTFPDAVTVPAPVAPTVVGVAGATSSGITQSLSTATIVGTDKSGVVTVTVTVSGTTPSNQAYYGINICTVTFGTTLTTNPIVLLTPTPGTFFVVSSFPETTGFVVTAYFPANTNIGSHTYVIPIQYLTIPQA